MPRMTLGLDLGPNSIGWALVEEDEAGDPARLEAMGVRAFQEMVDRKSKTPKNRKRRDARLARRQTRNGAHTCAPPSERPRLRSPNGAGFLPRPARFSGGGLTPEADFRNLVQIVAFTRRGDGFRFPPASFRPSSRRPVFSCLNRRPRAGESSSLPRSETPRPRRPLAPRGGRG